MKPAFGFAVTVGCTCLTAAANGTGDGDILLDSLFWLFSVDLYIYAVAPAADL